MPNIIDVIFHQNKYFLQKFLILDTMPDLLYERHGSILFATDDGFFDCYGYEAPSRNSRAFGGREFDIRMKDGSTIKANGQWWSIGAAKHCPEPLVSVGISTLPLLEKCYVFSSGNVFKSKLNAWLAEHEPSTDYAKYDPRNQSGLRV